MACINRLILVLLFLVPTLFSGTASAYVADRLFAASSVATAQNTFSTPNASCNYLWHKMQDAATPAQTYTIKTNTYTLCEISGTGSGATILTQAPENQFQSCDGGVTFQAFTGTCAGSCPAPLLTQPDGTCKNPCKAGCNGACGNTFEVMDSSVYASLCINNCKYWTNEGVAKDITNASTIWTIGDNTGQTCTLGAGTPNAGPPPTPCPACECIKQGKSYGTVNGVVTCVAKGSGNAAPVTSVSPPKITESTPKPTAANPDPTPVVTQSPLVIVTSNPASAGTGSGAGGNGSDPNLTVESQNPDGSKTKKTEKQSDFCAENPNDKICKPKENTFSGSCSGGSASVQCEGDAITCAIAKQQLEDNCKAQQVAADISQKPAYTTGEKLLNGEFDPDVQNFMNHTGDSSRNVTLPSSLSENGSASFGSAGFSDISISAMGQSMSLPFSKVNDIFGYFGYILLGLAYLGAYKIVSGAF